MGLIGSAVLALIRYKQLNTKTNQIYIYIYIFVYVCIYICKQQSDKLELLSRNKKPKRKDLCYQKSKFKISVIKCLKVPTEYSYMNN